jgi:hypothetical protein
LKYYVCEEKSRETIFFWLRFLLNLLFRYPFGVAPCKEPEPVHCQTGLCYVAESRRSSSSICEWRDDDDMYIAGPHVRLYTCARTRIENMSF